MIYFGLDPGLTGAVAAIGPDGYARVDDLPVITDGKLKWIDTHALISIMRDSLMTQIAPVSAEICIERVQAFPAQGRSSCFNFGVTFGSMLAVCRYFGHPLHLVTPATWKKTLGLSNVKKASLDRAKILFPDVDLRLQKHEGRAEALLIAHWLRSRQRPV